MLTAVNDGAGTTVVCEMVFSSCKNVQIKYKYCLILGETSTFIETKLDYKVNLLFTYFF